MAALTTEPARWIDSARAACLAFVAGWVARPVFRHRDRRLLSSRPDIARAYAAIQRARSTASPYRTGFEAVRTLQAQGITTDALVWGETPLCVAHAHLERAGVGPSSTVVDLGAGQGMVLLAARLLGAQARGVELDAQRVAPVRETLLRAGVVLDVRDARDTPLAGATHVWLSWTCMPPTVRDAIGVRLAELDVGARVIATTWRPSGPWTILSEERVFFPWGTVDVVTAERRAS